MNSIQLWIIIVVGTVIFGLITLYILGGIFNAILPDTPQTEGESLSEILK